MKGRNLEANLLITRKDGKLTADFISLNLLMSYIRRMMRKGTDYVEDSFETKCKDTALVIKPFLITRNKVSRAVRNNLRQTAREFLIAYTTIKTKQEIFSDVTANKIQKELSLKLKKIYPLALCEIRMLKAVEKK